MAKHNKKRNPALIYEMLTKEAAIAANNGENEKSKLLIALIKEGFQKGSELRKELDIFNSLLDKEGNLTEKTAEKLISEAKRLHEKLDHKKLDEEKGKFIAVINRRIGKHVWSNFVPNYRSMATVAQLFSDTTPLRTKVLMEQKIAEGLCKKKEIAKPLKPLSDLEFRMFIKRFNEVYGKSEELLQEQKELLGKYVMSIGDATELGLYLYEEIGRLKAVLKGAKAEGERKEKIEQVIELLEKATPTNPSKELIKTVFRCQSLAREIQK